MPIERPESKLVYSTDRTQSPQLRRPRTHQLIFAAPLAAHLATLGHLVEQVVLKKDDKVCWRVSLTAEADMCRYQTTLRILDEGRRLTQAKLQGGVYDGPREQRG